MVNQKIDTLQTQLDKLQAENVYLVEHIRELERFKYNNSRSTTISE